MLPCDASLKWGSGSLGSGKRHKSVQFSQRSINICKTGMFCICKDY